MTFSSVSLSIKRLPSILAPRTRYQQLIEYNPSINQNSLNKGWIHTSPTLLGKITPFKLADIGEGIFEAELIKWHKSVGDNIEEMEELCEVQSDKAAVEISSRYTGKITKLYHNVGDFVKIGANLIDIEMEGEEEEFPETPKMAEEPTPSAPTPSPFSPSADANSKASPATKRLAKEMNVDLSKVVGTGKDGRIQKSDIEEYAMKSTSKESESSPTPSETKKTDYQAVSMPKFSERTNQDVPLKGFPKAMFKAMTENVKVPHLNIAEQMNITKILKMRSNMKKVAQQEYGMNLTITPIIIKALSCCLTKYPQMNSKVDPSGEKYTIYGSHNVSIAMDTPGGLVVPNIKGVQDLTLIQVQQELARLQNLAQMNKLSPADLTGGTVSLSNVGVAGGTSVKALLFDGQALIVSVSRTQKLPRFDENGNVEAQDIVEMGFSADHRHCDGATVARFATAMKKMMEEPEVMMMNM